MAEHFETVSVILPTTEGEISPVLLAEKTVESDATPNPPVASVPPLVLSFDKGELDPMLDLKEKATLFSLPPGYLDE
ncbi:unnamed protein product [Larinioides sclopetarius]|uniref:Uncharacterized protein n=1 Tax=Larinioides sclopetarius TaxID=280406 RepID=A0AAV2BN27_9ARAC